MSKPNEPDQINTGALAMAIVLVTLATLAIALYVTSLVRDEVDDFQSTRATSQDMTIRELRADQLGGLNQPPEWLDQAKGLVSMPIQSAMTWVTEAVRKNPQALTPGLAPEAMGGAGPADAAPAEQPEGEAAAAASEEAAPAPLGPTASSPAETPAPVAPAPKLAAPAPEVAPVTKAPVVPQPAPAAPVAPAPAPAPPAPTP